MLLAMKADKSSRLHASFDYNLRRNKYMGNKTQDKENMQGCPCLQSKSHVHKTKTTLPKMLNCVYKYVIRHMK